MKTGTTCTRCANAATCPKFDDRMLYGFCRGFEPRRKRKMLTWARHSWRWLKIWMAMWGWFVRESFLKIGGEMEGDKKELSEAEKEAELHWEYIKGVLQIHDEIDDRIMMCGHHYKTAFIHGWKHGREAMNGSAKG